MRPRRLVPLLALALVAATFVAVPATLAQDDGTDDGNVVRVLPASVRCGDTFQVTLLVDPPSGTDAWIVDETPPEDANVSDVSTEHNGEHVDSGHVKWVSTNGAQARLTYNVTVPEDAADGSVLSFTGEYRFDPSMDARDRIGGETDLAIACGSVTRTMPPGANPGATVTVQLTVAPPGGTDSWIVDEAPPDGLTVTDVDSRHNGELVSSGNVKWVSTNGAPATLTYNVTIPEEATDGDTFTFDGEYRFDPDMPERDTIRGDTTLFASRAERSLPTEPSCGDTITVEVHLAPSPGTTSWLVEEFLPGGWTVTSSSGGLTTETQTGVKFTGSGAGNVTLTYTVDLPDDAEGTYTLGGEYRLHPSMDERATIGGDANLAVTCSSGSGGGGGGGGGGGSEGSSDDGPTGPSGGGPTSPSGPGGSSGPIQATQVSTPAGARAAYQAALSGSQGDRVTVEVDGACVPSLELGLAAALDDAQLSITVWASDQLPTGMPALPLEVDVPCLVELDIEGSTGPHEVSLSLDVPADEVSQPAHALLLRSNEGPWNPVGPLDLEATGEGTLRGQIETSCCSYFALAADNAPPVLQLHVPRAEPGDTVNVTALALDNVGIDRVEFVMDGELVETVTATDPDEPFVVSLDTSGMDAGEHEIHAVAYDLVGQAFQDSGTLVLETGAAPPAAGPGGAPGDGFPIWGTLLTALLLALLVALAMYGYRRMREPGGEPDTAKGPDAPGDDPGTPARSPPGPNSQSEGPTQARQATPRRITSTEVPSEPDSSAASPGPANEAGTAGPSSTGGPEDAAAHRTRESATNTDEIASLHARVEEAIRQR